MAPRSYLLIRGIVVSAILLPTLGFAQVWTRFRGPEGTGAVEKAVLPAQIQDSNIAWKTPLPGKGHSSPVVWGERVFLQSGDPASAKRYLLCVSLTSGELLWTREFDSGKSKLHGRNSYGTSTPTVDAERVYDADVAQEIIYGLCLCVHQHPHAGGLPLLAQLKTWYLEGALNPTAFSLLTVHATALINA